MATLLITKTTDEVWIHEPSDNLQYIVSDLYCKTTGDYFRVIEKEGRERSKYKYSDVSVKVDGTTQSGFNSSIALMNYLKSVDYVGFKQGGGGTTGFNPTIVSPQNGDVIVYNDEDAIWENKQLDFQGNRFTEVEEVVVQNTNEVLIPIGFEWVINGNSYANTVDFVQEIDYTSTGTTRIDKFVALTNNSFMYIQGDEGGAEPVTPPNTLEVTTINVTDSSIGINTQPVIDIEYTNGINENNNTVKIGGELTEKVTTIGDMTDKVGIEFDQENNNDYTLKLSAKVAGDSSATTTLKSTLGYGEFSKRATKIVLGEEKVLEIKADTTNGFNVVDTVLNKGLKSNTLFAKTEDGQYAQWGDVKDKADKANPTFTGSVVIPNATNNNEAVALGQVLKNQITKSGNQTLDNTYNGKVVTFTGSGTFTVNNTIANEGSFALKVETGVTVAWAITAPATWRVGGLTVGTAPRSLVGGDMVYVARKGSSNEIEVYGL